MKPIPSIFEEKKTVKIGPSSESVILPKDWVDQIKERVNNDDFSFFLFGKEFLMIEIKGLPIRNKKTQKLLNTCKKHFAEVG